MRISSEIQSLCSTNNPRYAMDCVAVDTKAGLACATDGSGVAYSVVQDADEESANGTVLVPAKLLAKRGEKILQLNGRATRTYPPRGKQPETQASMSYGEGKFPPVRELRLHELGQCNPEEPQYLRVILDANLLINLIGAIRTIGSNEYRLELSIPMPAGDCPSVEQPVLARFMEYGNRNVAMFMPMSDTGPRHDETAKDLYDLYRHAITVPE